MVSPKQNRIKSGIFFTTKKGNNYCFDKRKKKLILCHPLFFYILNMLEAGIDLKVWLNQQDQNEIKIENLGAFPREEIEYYYEKYLLLRSKGYFDYIDQKSILKANITPKEINKSLANTSLVTLEATNRCSLRCGYCGYGEFYNDYDKRKNKDMPIEMALSLLDYLKNLWNSSLNISHDRSITIGFYGGEPLLNFPFIQKVIDYAKGLELKHNRFVFSMTTNGLLLKKYMDFLVNNDFSLLISLDGNEINNSYRIYKNGKPSFNKLMENLKVLENKYPVYFKNRVNFNAVLHDRNSVSEIKGFFKKNFNKKPSIGTLSTSGINEDKKNLFWRTYSNIYESLYKSNDYSSIEEDLFINLPNIKRISLFLHHCTDLSFRNYNDLFNCNEEYERYPTGTCIPFSKKIFVTVSGKILACEKIGHKFELGYIDSKNVKIDFSNIAAKYRKWLNKVIKKCYSCYNADQCIQCIFNLDLSKENPSCNGFMTLSDYSKQISSYIGYIENKPGICNRIFKEVIFE